MRRSSTDLVTAVVVVATALGLALPGTALAQDDRAAGLFAQARQLPLVSQALRVRVAGSEARLELSQVFANDGAELAQADYQLLLPEGAQVEGFGFYVDDRLVRAELKKRAEATAAHRAAADRGRATALLTGERAIQRFSVFPLRAGEQKRVLVELRVPVAMELGRYHLQLPVDSFVGQAAVPTTVLCEIATEARLAGFGSDGHRPQVIARSPQRASLALTARAPVDLWWHEEMPPLLTRAAAVAVIADDAAEGARHGAQIQVALYDGGAWRAPYAALHLLVDASPSLRRRAVPLRSLIERVLEQAPVAVEVHAVGERLLQPLPGEDPDALLRALDALPWIEATGRDLVHAAARLGCGLSEVRCAVVTDPQLPDLAALAGAELRTMLLADAHEAAYFEDTLPPGAALFQIEADPPARLLQLADQLTLPVLQVLGLSQGDRELTALGEPARRVAEGGLLRLHTLVDALAPITLRLDIEGQEIVRQVALATPDPDSEAGQTVRRGVYGQLLATWMARYRTAPDPALRQRIVQVSLREGIPTAFTVLHAAAPELSVASTLPGDPVLSVQEEPGLVEVEVWYPFGERRRLVHDPAAGTFSDRFLIPRGWAEAHYRIEIFKRYDDGRVELAHAYYRIDGRGPQAALLHEPETGLLSVVTGDETPSVASVIVHGEDGRALPLSPVGQSWTIGVAELSARFTVFVRDRAGNRSGFDCHRDGDALRVATRDPARLAPIPASTRPARAWLGSTTGLSLDGEELVLTTERGERRFAASDLHLRALTLSARLRLGPGHWLLGTAGGDLLRLRCDRAGCWAARIDGVQPWHPVTGLEVLDRDRVLVGVLGQGLLELRDQRLRPSPLRVGSRYVTAIARHDGELFVGTAYRGLWQVRGRRALRTRFAHPHVAALWSTAHGLEVHSGHGRFVRDARGRFAAIDRVDEGLRQGAPDLVHAARHGGKLYLAGLDSGLWRVGDDTPVPVDLELTPMQRRLNALAVHDGLLWLGSEGGLLGVDPDAARIVRTALDGVGVHDLASTAGGLAVASARGLYLLGADGALRRLDAQTSLGTRSFTAVAEVAGRLHAGTKEGLFVVAGDGLRAVTVAQGLGVTWVTSLLAHGGALYIGTYDSGVYRLDGARVQPVAGLASQWVPPLGLSAVDGEVWVGGLGMPLVRIDGAGRVDRLSLPVRDVNHVVPGDGGLLALSSDGLVRLDRKP